MEEIISNNYNIVEVNTATTYNTNNRRRADYTNMSVLELIEKFITKKEYDNKTANDYSRDIQEFIFIMTKMHDLERVTVTDIIFDTDDIEDSYIDALQNSIKSKDPDNKLKKNSANTKIAHVNCFYEWIVKKFRSNSSQKRLIQYNPFDSIDRFKVDRKKDNVGSDALTENEVIRLFDYLDEYSKINPILGKRNRLMIELDLTIWLRRKALSQLTLDDFIQLDNGNYLCTKDDKYDKENENVIDADLYNRLVEFYNENRNCRSEYYGDNNASKNHNTIFGIGDAMFNNIIKDIANKIGIDNKKITAHSMRKTGVTISQVMNFNRADIQRQAGHSKEETLNIYDKNGKLGNNVVGMNMMKNIMSKRNEVKSERIDKDDNSIKDRVVVSVENVNDVEDIALSRLNNTEILNLISKLQNKLSVGEVG